MLTKYQGIVVMVTGSYLELEMDCTVLKELVKQMYNKECYVTHIKDMRGRKNPWRKRQRSPTYKMAGQRQKMDWSHH